MNQETLNAMGFPFLPQAVEMVKNAEADSKDAFSRIETTALYNQAKVLSAFQSCGVVAGHLFGSNGYGYGDIGRETLEKLFALSLGAEDALVRPQIVSGTHAIFLSLRGLLKSGDTLFAISGTPYDTIQSAIGIVKTPGSLMEQGVKYREQPLLEGDRMDQEGIIAALKEDASIKVCAIQRSSGYSFRKPISLEDMHSVISAIHAARPDVFVFVDNCYGEFTQIKEPTDLGADVIAGSLIKNPGGGVAPTGGYIVGTKAAIERIEGALTVPGLGREVGSYEASYRPYYQGLFMAPSVTANALKTAVLFANVFARMGYTVTPGSTDDREDIIQSIQFGSPEKLIAFCRSIQRYSPVDSSAVPTPWDMPGYEDPVIMAAGTFVSGASIELSADGPMRPPYTGYFQGSITYEHGKLACIACVNDILRMG
ncbi:MAG: hypothetical protein E7328_06865 [Clostridiales bacterium]|nr:hypothetical protein [Clostridiales bacterium]